MSGSGLPPVFSYYLQAANHCFSLLFTMALRDALQSRQMQAVRVASRSRRSSNERRHLFSILSILERARSIGQ
jgi:hypothetical protein